MIRNFNKKIKKSLQAGFTLLEMLMVLIIFGVITTIVVWNYGAFNNQIVLTNTAYEVAMQIREAQVYSFGVRGNKDDFEGNYGVVFYLGQNSSPVGNFIFFIDKKDSSNNKDGYCRLNYNSNSSSFCTCDIQTNPNDECLSRIFLNRNIKIYKIIGYNGTSKVEYQNSYITFERPLPDAKLLSHDTGPVRNLVKTEIVLKSPDNQYKSVIINKNGYISVADYNPN